MAATTEAGMRAGEAVASFLPLPAEVLTAIIILVGIVAWKWWKSRATVVSAPQPSPVGTAGAAVAQVTPAASPGLRSSRKGFPWQKGLAWVVFLVVAVFVIFVLWTWLDDFTRKNMPALRSSGPGTTTLSHYENLIPEGEAWMWNVSYTSVIWPREFGSAIAKRGPRTYRISDDSYVTRHGVKLRIYTEVGELDPSSGRATLDQLFVGECRASQTRPVGVPPRVLCAGTWEFSIYQASGPFEISHNGTSGSIFVRYAFRPNQYAEAMALQFFKKSEQEIALELKRRAQK